MSRIHWPEYRYEHGEAITSRFKGSALYVSEERSAGKNYRFDFFDMEKEDWIVDLAERHIPADHAFCLYEATIKLGKDWDEYTLSDREPLSLFALFFPYDRSACKAILNEGGFDEYYPTRYLEEKASAWKEGYPLDKDVSSHGPSTWNDKILTQDGKITWKMPRKRTVDWMNSVYIPYVKRFAYLGHYK